MSERHILVDSDGDHWEVLPESGYFPRQEENWVRYQDEAMRDKAEARIGARVVLGGNPDVVADEEWSAVYRESGHPRVWVREVPHPGSSGDSWKRGGRGVSEVIGWFGAGAPPMFVAGGMQRALVRPSARWYEDMAAAARTDLANLGDGPELDESRAALRALITYNERAATIASQHARELTLLEMQAAVVAAYGE